MFCGSFSALGDSIYTRPTSCTTEYFSLPPGKEKKTISNTFGIYVMSLLLLRKIERIEAWLVCRPSVELEFMMI